MMELTFCVLLSVQVVLAVLDPWGFPYLRGVTIVIQLVALRSLVKLVFAPAAFIELARDRRARIVHGFEHATIAILRAAGVEVSEGLSVARGFSIQLPHRDGAYERFAEVEAAARAAIERIGAGETRLAYSTKCGTSWLVADVVVSLAIVGLGIAALVHGIAPGITFAATVVTIVLAQRAAVPLGLLAQRAWTVSTAFTAARVLSVTRTVAANGRRVGYDVAIEAVPRDDRAEPVAMP
jgi:uncharacterized protein DUF6391